MVTAANAPSVNLTRKVEKVGNFNERGDRIKHLSECWLSNSPEDEDARCTCDDNYPDADSD